MGLPLVAIPTHLLGRALAPLLSSREASLFEVPLNEESAAEGIPFVRRTWYPVDPDHARGAFVAFATSWASALLGALGVLAIYLVNRQLGVGSKAALTVATLVGIASPWWHYSKQFFSEGLGGVGISLFLLFALRAKHHPERQSEWWWGGAALGMAIAAKPVHAVFIFPALILVAAYVRNWPPRIAARALAAAGLSLLAVVACVAAYNHARFGSPLETGYGAVARWSTPWWKGTLGLLVSPGRGLFVYFPLALASLALFGRFAARFRAESIFVALCGVCLVGIYAKWQWWDGGWCWGPRFLLPAVPLLGIPWASLIEAKGLDWRHHCFAALVLLSAMVAFLGVWVNYVDFYTWLRAYAVEHVAQFSPDGMIDHPELAHWSWLGAPVIRYWDAPVGGDLLLLRAFSKPGLVLVLDAVLLLGLLAAIQRIRAAIRQNPGRP
ncbi:MAG: phospholipid carrier-dependent glycosyltransferase [Myxococcales bacterium]|nr:phospholipid carrier-dependent glycosyltransferase [Myxococcales bacterium]